MGSSGTASAGCTGLVSGVMGPSDSALEPILALDGPPIDEKGVVHVLLGTDAEKE